MEPKVLVCDSYATRVTKNPVLRRGRPTDNHPQAGAHATREKSAAGKATLVYSCLLFDPTDVFPLLCVQQKLGQRITT